MTLTDHRLERPASAPPAIPRWATPRSERPTLGPRVAEVAELVGIDLMDWQRQVLDVALEVDPDTGQLVYREIRLTVPRQSGKTTLLLALMTHRCIGFDARQRVVFTMQTAGDARRKLFEDYLPTLLDSPIGPRVDVREANGNERLRFPNSSIWSLMASTEKAGHGAVIDLGVVDEAFTHDARVEQAIKPAQITRGSAQFWLVSTMGTSRHDYFNDKIATGRQAVEQGRGDGVAYFEWSADPDDDPADPDTWWRCMPALGVTVPIEAIAADYASTELDEFKRAYLNIMHDTTRRGLWQVITEAGWGAALDSGGQLEGRLSFGVDVAPDRSRASIAVAGDRAAGDWQVEVIDSRGGARWLVDRLVELHGKLGRDFRRVVVDRKSQAATIIDPLVEAGVPVMQVGLEQHSRMAASLFDAVEGGGVWHRGQADLTDAAAGASQRRYGDAWLWDRRSSAIDISPLVAATLALGGHTTHDDDDDGPAPVFAY